MRYTVARNIGGILIWRLVPSSRNVNIGGFKFGGLVWCHHTYVRNFKFDGPQLPNCQILIWSPSELSSLEMWLAWRQCWERVGISLIRCSRPHCKWQWWASRSQRCLGRDAKLLVIDYTHLIPTISIHEDPTYAWLLPVRWLVMKHMGVKVN